MSDNLTYSGVLVVTECWCGIAHAIPESLNDVQVRQHRDGKIQTKIYCPLGHSHILAGEGVAKRLERQLALERSSHDQTKAELRETESRRRAEKAAKTKLKKRVSAKRVSAGVCPCCKRTFQNLARHMKNKHPEEVK